MLFAVASRWQIEPMAMSLLNNGMVMLHDRPPTVLHRIAQLPGTHAAASLNPACEELPLYVALPRTCTPACGKITSTVAPSAKRDPVAGSDCTTRKIWSPTRTR